MNDQDDSTWSGTNGTTMLGVPSTALQWLGVGSVLLIAGALIRFRGWTFLIAGYDETSSVPEEVVADVVGNAVLRIGVAAIALGVLMAITDVPSYLPAVFGVIILLAVARLIYRLRTYTPSNAT
ncbi:DUF3784 domain-containing protein [Halopenitus persicus]|nr:DUF3784 domain-containing protein [Halopenitus persicus]